MIDMTVFMPPTAFHCSGPGPGYLTVFFGAYILVILICGIKYSCRLTDQFLFTVSHHLTQQIIGFDYAAVYHHTDSGGGGLENAFQGFFAVLCGLLGSFFF